MKTLLPLVCLLSLVALPLRASESAPGDETHAIAGIGAVLSPDVKGNGHQRLHDHVTIREVEPNGPALKNALRPGDEIVEVDGAKLAGMRFADAVNDHIRGPLGSPTKLVIVRDGKRMTVVLVRDIVPMPGSSQP